ncbi:hypothetical protein TWF730_008963 [Orbilia blumenaviensis]|uniref:J domain-containing protein n=1 Tax=Orbilia blumenaviensis TaxID=1796055 RepID=A0AAV9UX03_9PEZI
MLDYYRILNVSAAASGQDIKKAYRAKAKETHPDRNGGTTAATESFQKVQEAFECLSDPSKRAEYDRNKKQESSEPRTPHPNANPTPDKAPKCQSTPVRSEDEGVRFQKKWEAHNLQRQDIDGRRSALISAKQLREDYKRQLKRAQDRIQMRRETFNNKNQSGSSNSSANYTSSRAGIADKENLDSDGQQTITRIGIRLSWLEMEVADMEKIINDWDDKEAQRFDEAKSFEYVRGSREGTGENKTYQGPQTKPTKRKAEGKPGGAAEPRHKQWKGNVRNGGSGNSAHRMKGEKQTWGGQDWWWKPPEPGGQYWEKKWEDQYSEEGQLSEGQYCSSSDCSSSDCCSSGCCSSDYSSSEYWSSDFSSSSESEEEQSEEEQSSEAEPQTSEDEYWDPESD